MAKVAFSNIDLKPIIIFEAPSNNFKSEQLLNFEFQQPVENTVSESETCVIYFLSP
ncbi:hypothetical protein ANSO36C_31000 [Nostoc cf. commune SO-36]|uniref:Uncharacterized protein n=1 Tax=Nostoc cf. commune SO-36 TaxID=449208 RepID=A0ABN6Q7B7_NOSCO|nr:hypothetical protein ANSO36C_31000 [Nostoc cf. commune SO-36]